MENRIITVRDQRIDTMRVIGTFLVILAHVSAPELLQKLRTFDVVMLVFISGLSFAYKNNVSYGEYLLRRVKKLVLPTYAVITCLFIGAYIVCTVVGRTQLFSWDTIWRSYVFADGVGYIWIVKVYMLIAAVSPLVYRAAKEIKSDALFAALIVGIYGVYHVLMYFFGDIPILYQYVFQIFPYTLVACIGMRCRDNRSFCWKILIVACVIMVTDVAVRGAFVFEQHKYPPEYNYLVYGLFMAALLYILLPDKTWSPVVWLSKNSFMIYLFHVIFLLATNFLAEIKVFAFVGVWYVQFVIVVAASVLATVAINFISTWICTKRLGRKDLA